MSQPLLRAEGLGYRAPGGQALLADVSLDIHAGDRLAIIGPNGSGKTTLLRLLAGLHRPAAGTVNLHGRALSGLAPAERALDMAVVGQVDVPDHRLALRDYVGLGRIPHHGRRPKAGDRAIVEAAMVRTGLDAFAHRAIGSLSGGERQRAQIARALAQEPKILFLDEPTNHLDPRARAELMRLVASLELTVVAVLHDLPIVPDFATRVAVLEGGRMVCHGTPDTTLSRETIGNVFGIDLLRVPHPVENRHLMVFDLPTAP